MPIVPILCGVLLIGGIVALVLSGASWKWYHITLGAFIMLFALGWFYLAAKNLEVQRVWRNEITQYETALHTEEQNNQKIIAGGPDAQGAEHESMAQLKTDLEKMLQGRGRVWSQVTRKAVAADGKITAIVDKPQPSGIEKNMVLYLFDDVDVTNSGQFLGIFEVTAVNGQEVTLTPALKLRASEVKRYAARKNDPLVMYEVMPTDSRELFAELSKLNPEWLSIFPKTVPNDVKEEYAKDQQPPTEDDMKSDRVWRRVKATKDITVLLSDAEAKSVEAASKQELEVDPATKKKILKIPAGTEMLLDPKTAQEQIAAGDAEAVAENGAVYVRPLRDYVRLFRDWNLQIEELVRKIAETDSENAAVQDAQQKVAKDIEYRTAEVAALKSDLAAFRAETEMIKKHVAALEKQVAKVNGDLEKTVGENRHMESQLANYQRQAAAEINRRIKAELTEQ